MSSNDEVPGLTPDPALSQLHRYVGTWDMEGSLEGSDEKAIKGRATYRMLPGGFFLEQRITLDFAGYAHVESLELVGYDPETGTFPSLVYSNMSPQPLPYTWTLDGDSVTITVQHGPLDATFTGRWSEDGTTFGGGWRPNPGADTTVNIPYGLTGRRVD